MRAPSMPTGLSRARRKVRKVILSTADIRTIIEAAKADTEHGIYYGFPFLAGTRPSEQLGLLWDDVDFAKGVIHIRRIQERDGSTTDMTKTAAGTREVPMGATLREMLLAWRVRCPRLDGQLHRVFPGPGRLQPWPKPRLGGGTALLYQNFRRRYWEPPFKRLGLPYVTPHSARHSFISTLQAQGIEVGLVAKIAGHANPTVTLGHYTQAVRGGEAAMLALEQAYATPDRGYVVFNHENRSAVVVALEEAARICGLCAQELLGAIDDDGLFENGRFTVADYARPDLLLRELVLDRIQSRLVYAAQSITSRLALAGVRCVSAAPDHSGAALRPFKSF